jgi:predicted RNase H-like nuclease (RuvC/YqgF family)
MANRNLETVLEEFEKRLTKPSTKITNVDSSDYRAEVEQKTDQIARLTEEIKGLKRENAQQERKISELSLEIYGL